MSKVLVTGANGFVGSWLTRALVERGHEVRVLVRPSSDLSDLQGLSIMPWSGDITDVDSIARAAEGCDSIFHLAGLIAYKKAERAKMELVNVQGTQNVVDVCLDKKIRRLVYLSSVVAIGAGRGPQEILNEESAFNISDLDLGYFETKKKAEEIVLGACKNRGLNAVALNPSTIYGPGDAKKSSRKTQAKVAQGKFPFYTNGGVSIVDIDDVIPAILTAWEKGRCGERYILSGENILIRELFSMIAKAAGVEAPKYKLPNFVLHALGIAGDIQYALTGKSSLSRENAWTATLYHWFDSSKARRELGFNPRPAYQSIEKSVHWMRDHAYIV